MENTIQRGTSKNVPTTVHIKGGRKNKVMWAGHAWRKNDTMIKAVIEEDSVLKRPLDRPRLRWKTV